MDDFQLRRIKQIGKAARKAKIALNNVLNDLSRWNSAERDTDQFRPNLRALTSAVDALMDLNNTCNERERRHQKQTAKRKTT